MGTIRILQESGYIMKPKRTLDLSHFDLAEHDLEQYLNVQGFTLDGEAPRIEALLQSVDILFENNIITKQQAVVFGAKTRKLFEKHVREIIYS